MEPMTIAASALAILTPYVAKGAEEFIKAFGKDAYEKTKGLYSTLKAKWSGDEEAMGTLENYEEKPERYEPVLKSILEEKLGSDADLRAELSQQVKEVAPYFAPHIKVFQKVIRGEDLTGAEIDEMTRGTVEVTQDLDEVKNATGVRIKTLG